MAVAEKKEDYEGLKRAGAAVAAAREAMSAAVRPGMTTEELDAIGRETLNQHGAKSAPQLAYSFPGTTCISVNGAIAHGVPSSTQILQDGDLINIDVSCELDGYWADTGASMPVGKVSPEVKALLKATRHALRDALEEVRTGNYIRNIGRAVERRARKGGYQVIRNLCGHGVGRSIHEEPEVANTFDPKNNLILTEGLVIAIEPFLTMSSGLVVKAEDGWTLKTDDGCLGAQFEHSVIVTKKGPVILT